MTNILVHYKELKILKLPDIIHLHISLLLYNFHAKMLPVAFNNFFQTVASKHHYNTRLSARSSYFIPYVRTNYGKFNIRYRGAKIWNSIDEQTKSLSIASFSKKIKKELNSLRFFRITTYIKP